MTMRTSSANRDEQQELKVVLLGDTGVGKTSILVRYVRNEFTEAGEPTIGAGFMSKVISCKGETLKFQIWDTAGQEKYHALAPMYYREAHIAFLVYDITNRASFEVLKQWVQELKEYGPPDLILGIAGNKSDLSTESEVEYVEVKEYAKTINAIIGLTSAKEDKGITDLFQRIGEEALTSQVFDKRSAVQSLKILKKDQTEQKDQTNKSGGCCGG